MMATAGALPPAEPLFLARPDGARFALFHAPAGRCRAAVLYLHPFAEEMNRARRMAALQSRALAANGVVVLQLDLHGCGDSSGDFADATWDGWLGDVAHALDWLRARCGVPVTLWGLRLGALLGLAHARRDPAIASLLLWQPVLGGAAHLTQFLRLRVAGDMLGNAAGGATTAALRAALADGETLDVAGYRLSPALALGMESCEAAALVPACPVHWIDVTASLDRGPAPASLRVADAWRAAGVAVELRQVSGEPFWATQEVATCPALINATLAALEPCHA
jgi:exosortase A-associated hydrolase 2